MVLLLWLMLMTENKDTKPQKNTISVSELKAEQAQHKVKKYDVNKTFRENRAKKLNYDLKNARRDKWDNVFRPR